MIRNTAVILLTTLASTTCLWAMDLEKVDQDLNTPSVTNGVPAPGKRVKLFLPKYDGTDVYHSLYLPIDWKKEEKYPVIVEYSGNKWQNSQGTVDECDLGYGITEGKGVIWICLPFVDKQNAKNAATWWGDVDATVDYCKQAVRTVCAEYGGDSSKVFIAGFSRGAIACNYIGLHDDKIASLWRGFICHSHYDGVKQWEYTGSDRSSAAVRLKRLGNRPQFISHEKSVDPTKTYLKKAFPSGNFTFLALPFADHTDQWVLRDIPERKILREWFENALKEKGQQAPADDDLKAAPEEQRDVKRVYGSVVEEYPLVYPEWEYGTVNEGCPYRYNGIKVHVSAERHIIIVSQGEKLPNKGDVVVMHTSGLSAAHLGSVAGLPAYDISKVEHEVVKQKTNNQQYPYSEPVTRSPQR